MNRGSRERSRQYRQTKQLDDQDEFLEVGPLNEDELKGSRQWHDREHYGSVNYVYPLRRLLHPSDLKSFSGVGPKNYKRTDERIEEEVCNVLMKDRNIDASNIEVHVRGGVVLLSGTVEGRMDKIEAEMAIEGITGVEDIQNEIKVKKWGDYSDRPYQREYGDRNPGEKDKDQSY